MIRAALPMALIASIGPVGLGVPPPRPVMVFDVRRVPTIGERIVREAARQGVPPHLALATAWRESKMDPNVPPHVERDGSRSWWFFQLNDRWYPDAATMDLRTHIRKGVADVGEKLKRCGAAQLEYAFTHGHCRNSRLERP